MTTVRIDRFRHRTVLPAGAARQPAGPQVERSLDALLSLLPAVIGDLGLPASTVVCVRSIRVRLRVGDPELADVTRLALRWAESIASAIDSACRSSGNSGAGVAESADGDVVVFRNQVAALADLVQCLAFGDRRRQWAWQQAGLGAGDHESPAAALVVTACLLTSAAAIPVLAWAAGRQLLRRLTLTWPDWHRLAAGLVPDLPAAAVSGLDVQPQPGAAADPVRSAGTAAVLAAVLAASPLAPALRETARRFGEPAGPARLSVTALALRAAGLATAGDQVDGAEPDGATWTAAELATAATVLFASDRHRAGPASAAQPASSTRAVRRPDDRDRPGVVDGSVAVGPGRAGPAPAPMLPDEQVPADGELTPLGRLASGPEPADVWTAHGGLLFGLNLAVLQQIVAQARTHERGMHWCLLALGARLAEADQGDAAVRVFAGLPAAQRLGDELTAPPDDTSQPLLDAWVAAVDAELALRLAPAGQHDTPESLRRSVVRRVARLLIDPGWIEAELRLDTVDVGVRRAGLDLDPGAVRHLRCVVRFRYV